MSRSTRPNLLIAQGGGPTAVINCSLYGVLQQAQAGGAVGAILGARHGILGVINEELIDLARQPVDTVDGLKSTPGAALGSCRYKLKEDEYRRVLHALRKHDIGIFLYNGGNDSMDTALQVHRLAKKESVDLRVIGIPKTIDNDVGETDRCPGFGSAARYVAQSVRDIGEDVRSLPTPISIFETMGRNAGWLAASAALARRRPGDAPHLIYLPERPFDPDQFLSEIEAAYRDQGWAVAVVSEGIRLADGQPVHADGRATQTDAFGHHLPGNVGSALAHLVSARLKLRSRSEKPGLCGRSSISLVSPVDQQDAEAVGRAAVDAALAGESGMMITLLAGASSTEEPRTGLAELEAVAHVEKTMPDDWIAPSGNDVATLFNDYARPLIGGDLLAYARLDHARQPT